MAAAAATEEPQPAAKPAEAILAATARPPGSAESHRRAALNNDVAIPET